MKTIFTEKELKFVESKIKAMIISDIILEDLKEGKELK